MIMGVVTPDFVVLGDYLALPSVATPKPLSHMHSTHARPDHAGASGYPLEPMPTTDDIKQRIEAGIPGAQADVEDWTGGGDHFRATVVADAFAGLSRLQQHRLVYDLFGAEIGGPIHALSLKTLSPQS
jgi:stress-induced morphogen